MEKDNIIFGIRAVIEANNSGVAVDKIFVQKEAQGHLMRELMGTLKASNVTYSYVPVEKLNRYTTQNHQGVVATIAPIKFYKIEDMVEQAFAVTEKPLFLILDGVSDARNFGAIIRTAECSGVNGIIIAKNGAAPVNGDTVKTS